MNTTDDIVVQIPHFACYFITGFIAIFARHSPHACSLEAADIVLLVGFYVLMSRADLHFFILFRTILHRREYRANPSQ